MSDVKLDARLAQNLADDSSAQNRLRSLAEALNKHEITTVMSGIEDLPTLYALWSCGIHFVQGFFVQRPNDDMSYDFESGASPTATL